MIRETTPTEAASLAQRIAEEVAPRLSLPRGRLEVLRVGASVLVALPDERVLLRIEPSARELSSRRQVAAAQVLAATGVPAARLVGTGPQPVAADGHWVTAWELLEHVEGARPDPAALGSLARQLHRRTAEMVGRPGSDGPPALDPFAAMRAQLATAREVATRDPATPGHVVGDVEEIAALVEETADRWRSAGDDGLGRALVHGDLHRENVVVTPAGPVLVDLEMAGVGPASYDLAPALVAVQRYGADPDDQRRFTAAYGTDLRELPTAELRTTTFALWTTSWALGHRHVSPLLADEAALRVAHWRGDADDRPWTLR